MKRLINKAIVAHEFKKFTTKKATLLSVVNKLQNARMLTANQATCVEERRVGRCCGRG